MIVIVIPDVSMAQLIAFIAYHAYFAAASLIAFTHSAGPSDLQPVLARTGIGALRPAARLPLWLSAWTASPEIVQSSSTAGPRLQIYPEAAPACMHEDVSLPLADK